MWDLNQFNTWKCVAGFNEVIFFSSYNENEFYFNK